VLIRHGFDYIAEQTGFRWTKCSPEETGPVRNASSDKRSAPQRVRFLFEDLGPTFVKLGQLLSTRPDLIPREYVSELENLQDNVEEVETGDIRRQFSKEMGRPPEEVFKYFNYRPLASASIGQVHEALLPGGEQVVVKIQRPHLHQLIKRDLSILKSVTNLLQNKTIIGQVCNVHEIIDVFERQIKRELDFDTEALNTEVFFREFAGNDRILVPRIYWDYSTAGVLTMEYLSGVRVEELVEGKLPEDIRREYARHVILAVFQPLFTKGIFHGDPHPGNVLFQDERKVVLIDFGIVGRFDEDHRTSTAELMVALVERNVAEVMDIIMKTGIVTRRINQQRFYEDVAEIVDKANSVSSGSMELGRLINGMIKISVDHGILVPDNLFILGKTVVLCENISRRISPELNIAEIIKPLALEHLKNTLQPNVEPGNLYKQVSGIMEILFSLPRDLTKAIQALARGETRITFYHRNLNWLYDMLDVASSRISFSMIIAALIVGSTLIMHAGKGPQLWGYPLLGTVGFLFSGFLGVWVLIAMLRSGRLK
jgi:ubiquinone biosynthesis protein